MFTLQFFFGFVLLLGKNVECWKCMLCLLDHCTFDCVELKLDTSSKPLRGDLRGRRGGVEVGVGGAGWVFKPF